MERDALATTHPVVQRISSAEEISQAFDSITYEKGSAVINMLENYVGEDAWRAGVRAYMAKHAYGNTVSKICGARWKRPRTSRWSRSRMTSRCSRACRW
jgi:aminopeptidase N